MRVTVVYDTDSDGERDNVRLIERLGDTLSLAVRDTLDPVGMRVTEVIEIESDGEPDSVTDCDALIPSSGVAERRTLRSSRHTRHSRAGHESEADRDFVTV